MVQRRVGAIENHPVLDRHTLREYGSHAGLIAGFADDTHDADRRRIQVRRCRRHDTDRAGAGAAGAISVVRARLSRSLWSAGFVERPHAGIGAIGDLRNTIALARELLDLRETGCAQRWIGADAGSQQRRLAGRPSIRRGAGLRAARTYRVAILSDERLLIRRRLPRAGVAVLRRRSSSATEANHAAEDARDPNEALGAQCGAAFGPHPGWLR